MRTAVPEKIRKIIADIEAQGNASLTRLTVLKKWFEQRPQRLPAFGLWIARKAAGHEGKTAGVHRQLLDETRKLAGTGTTDESVFQRLEWTAAAALYKRAKMAQDEFQNQQWGPVRVIHCWPLMLVEEGLALHLRHKNQPYDGYKVAADWAQNFDSRYGNGLNGPSAGRLEELERWMRNVEAQEEMIQTRGRK